MVPIAKVKNPSVVSEFRPVALTSIISKCFERIILKRLKAAMTSTLDKNQFGYRENCSTEDALCTAVPYISSHLDKNPMNAVRCLFLDFSSAFNTISPVRLVQKLINMFQLPLGLCKLVFDFMIDRAQFVVTDSEKSNVETTNIGSPQGCILSPFLFCMYTNDLKSSDNNVEIIKYADDTLIFGKITNNDSAKYFNAVYDIEN